MRGSGRTRAFGGTTYTVFPVSTLSVAVYKMNINYKCHQWMFYVLVFFYRLINFTNCYRQYFWEKTQFRRLDEIYFMDDVASCTNVIHFSPRPCFYPMGNICLSMFVFKKVDFLYLKYWYVAMSSKIHLKWVYVMIKWISSSLLKYAMYF